MKRFSVLALVCIVIMVLSGLSRADLTNINSVNFTIALFDRLEIAARASKAAYVDEFLTRNELLVEGWLPVVLQNFTANSPEPGLYKFIYESKGVSGSSSALFLIKEDVQGSYEAIIAFGGSDDTADWINHFFSQWKGDHSEYLQSLAGFSEEARKFLNHMDLSRVILSGHSSGGAVVQNFLDEVESDNYNENDGLFWGVTFGAPGLGLNASLDRSTQNLLMIEHKDFGGKMDPVPSFFKKNGLILEIEYTFRMGGSTDSLYIPIGDLADERSGLASIYFAAHHLDSYIRTASILENAVTFNQWMDDVFSNTSLKRISITKEGTITITPVLRLSKTEISQLYVTIFNRASDGGENLYWQSLGLDMATTADLMLATDAAKNYFGNSLDSHQAFIEHIYLNTFNKTRAEDPDGIAYWVGLLCAGSSRGSVVAKLISVVEDYAPGGAYYNPSDAATIAAYNLFTNRTTASELYE